METLRNNDALPGAFPGLKIFSKEVKNLDTNAAQNYTIETGCQYIHSVLAHKWVTADGSTPLVVVPTIAASTTYPSTKKVTFAIPALSTLHFVVVGSVELANTVSLADNGGDVTETLFEP